MREVSRWHSLKWMEWCTLERCWNLWGCHDLNLNHPRALYPSRIWSSNGNFIILFIILSFSMYIHLQPFWLALCQPSLFVWRLDQAFLFAPQKKKGQRFRRTDPMESRRIFGICTLILECCFVAHLLLWLLRCRRSSPEPQSSALAQVASRIRQLQGWLWQWSKNQATWGWTLRFILDWYCLGWHHSLANDTPVQSMNGKEVWEVLR